MPDSLRHVNKWTVLVLVCMAQFMVVLDATVVNIALPSIQTGLKFSPADLQWVVNGYALTFGGFLLLGGRAGDLFGRQRVFLLGLAIFTTASIFDGFAQSSGMLILGRAVQGLGGALISPAALSIITSTFEEGQDRTRAMSVWSTIAASGAAFGLIIGAVLTQYLSWRWAFFVNGPVGAITWFAALRLVPNSKVEGEHGLDVWGAVSITAGLMAVVYALVNVSKPGANGLPQGWGSAPVIGWGLGGIALIAVFIIIERRHKAPLVRLSAFKSRSLSGANLTMFLTAGGMFAMFFFLGLYLQQVLGYSKLQAGFAFLPFCFGIGIGAGIASQLVKAIDVRYVASTGMALAALGYFLLMRTDPHSAYAGVILVPLLVMSVGMAFAFVPVTLIATTNIAGEDAGLASGLLNTSQQIGGALGLAILLTLWDSTATTYFTSHPAANPFDGRIAGDHVAYFAGGVLLLIAGVVVPTVIRRRDVEGISGVASDRPAAEEAVA